METDSFRASPSVAEMQVTSQFDPFPMAFPDIIPTPMPSTRASSPNPFQLQLLGLLLFLFIPLVLFLFVRHPEPMGMSLGAGVILMVGHRRLARPYMRRALPWKCVWCNRVLPETGGETVELRTGPEALPARCCAGHREPAARFFTFLRSWRWPLRLGIFVPLLVLLVSILAASLGRELLPLPDATAFFQLCVGITVNVAALGSLFVRESAPLEVPFPAHNFFLLGVRTLLWIFRLVGIWWIWRGLSHFLAI